MKQIALTTEQMKHLQELGVDISSASMVRLFLNDDGEILEWSKLEPTDERCVTDYMSQYMYYDEYWEYYTGVCGELLCVENGDYDQSIIKDFGSFTLQDILELLPNQINGYNFDITKINSDKFGSEYSRNGEAFKDAIFIRNSSLESAYNMLCWVAENGYINK